MNMLAVRRSAGCPPDGQPVQPWQPDRYDFVVFALFLEARRIHRGRTPGQAAREAEVTLDEFRRAVRGRDPGEAVYAALCAWIGEPAAFFLKREPRHG